MIKLTTIAVFAGLTMPLASPQSKPPADDAPRVVDKAIVDVLPIIHFDAESDMEVEVNFENTSEEAFHYLEGHRSRDVANLFLELYKNGHLVRPQRTRGEAPLLSKDRVLVLRPGESVLLTEKLRDRYGNLEPGRYELRVHYELAEGSVPHLQFGLTPLKIDRKVALLQVR